MMPSGDGDFDLLSRFQIGGELLGGQRIILCAQLGDGDGCGVAVGVGGFGEAQASLLAQRGDLAKLLAPLVVQLLFKLRFVHGSALRVDDSDNSVYRCRAVDGSGVV